MRHAARVGPPGSLRLRHRVGLTALLGANNGRGPVEAPTPSRQTKTPDVIFVPTAQEVVDKMLELAEVKEEDVVYDLGCGDGRIPVTAAKKYGVKAVGFDVDPKRIRRESTRTSARMAWRSW